MNRFIFLVVLVLLSQTCLTQTTRIFIYDYTYYKNASADKNYNEQYILKINGATSLFYSRSKMIRDSLLDAGGAVYMQANDEIINRSAGKIRVFNRVFTSSYQYEDSTGKIEWKLINEKDTINGIVCKKAITNFRNKEWIAWYATGIPINSGPWLLNGLPGLIVKAVADSGRKVFTVTGFENHSNLSPQIIELAKISKITNHDDFIKLRNHFNNNMMLYYQNDPNFKDQINPATGKLFFEYKGEVKRKLPTYFED